MDIDILKNGKERETYTDYIKQLINDISKLKISLENNQVFNGSIFMLSDRIMVIQCHRYLKLNIEFEKQPNQAEISFERKHLNLITIKLKNNQAISFIKQVMNEEIVIIEYNRFLTLLLPSLFVKILQKDKYERTKNKYLNRKSIKIYTGLKVIQ
ncbi:MAG: hypothetical protein PF513_06460 [Tenericutes bacterium]|jgi:hypothetical protein|nr:hypothetical protein [Mycoplasmatota bacterium]